MQHCIANICDHPRGLCFTVAVHVAKHPAERTQAVPTRLQRDLEDRQLRVAKQGLRPLQSAGKQIAVGRQTEGLFERSREMRLGNVAYTCQPFDRPGLVRGGVHSVLCA